jgi:hypothetical protein
MGDVSFVLNFLHVLIYIFKNLIGAFKEQFLLIGEIGIKSTPAGFGVLNYIRNAGVIKPFLTKEMDGRFDNVVAPLLCSLSCLAILAAGLRRMQDLLDSLYGIILLAQSYYQLLIAVVRHGLAAFQWLREEALLHIVMNG